MKKSIALVLAVLLIMGLLAACGGTASSSAPAAAADGSTAPAASSDAPAQTTGDGEVRTITWMSLRGSGWGPMTALADQYMAENPNVKIEFEVNGDTTTYFQKLKILAASGELPDLFEAEGNTFLAEIAATGALVDVDEFLAEINYDRMMPIGMDYARLDDGKLYSLCWENNIEYFWYHKDMFEQAGIEKEPETFDELLEVCEKLKTAGFIPVATFPGWALQRWLAFIPFRLTGNDFIESLKIGEAKMSDPVGIQAAEFFQTMGMNYFQPGWANSDYGTALESFLGGNAAIYNIGSWQFDSFLDENRMIKEDYDFFYMPTLEGAINGKTDMWAHAGTGTAINKGKMDDTLKDFLTFVLNNYPETSFYEYSRMPCMTFDTTLGTFSEFDELVLEDSNALTSAGMCWDVRLDAASNEVMQKEIVNLGMGAITPQEFADRVDAAIAENGPKAFGLE